MPRWPTDDALTVQLDTLALMKAHRGKDRRAVAVILANCDPEAVAWQATRMLAAYLTEEDLAELRDAALST